MTTSNNNQPKSVLVYQIGSLGDTLVSIPAYRAVRRHFGPDAQIRVLHNAPSNARASPHQVLEGSSLINGAVTFQQHNGRSTWKTWIEVWSKLRHVKVDAIAYIAPGERTPKQVQRDKLFFKLMGVRTLLGFHACGRASFHARGADGRPLPVTHEAILRLERLERDGIKPNRVADMEIPLLFLPAQEKESIQAWLGEQYRSQTVRSEKAIVAICPGSNQSAKFWPMERFEEIGRRLLDLEDIELVVIGGPAERGMGERLLAAWGQGINAAGQLSVMGSAALINQCRFLIGLDTGTTHLAAVLGIPCVALYADRDPPGQWEPLGNRHILLQNHVSCGGCGLTDCSVPDHPCMTGISVEQAWAAVQQVNARAVNTGFV